LAVTTSAQNAIGMGLATTAVLICSNVAISMIKKLIPADVRIPAYIVVISTFVTVVGMLMEAFVESLYTSLGLFIPLIVVNCIILARAESFASKNGVADSMLDGLGMGLGFTMSLTILGSVREIIGNGTIFGFTVLGAPYKPALLAIFPPGAFLVLGLLLALYNAVRMRSKKRKETGRA
ncbi:MAG: electron transport complex subunit RsxE, partial [Bacillota bacterium]|nr:electron transport complex subunit RsxE [Bacillota bacterium]